MNIPDFNAVAERVGALPIYRSVVLVAHGMRSRGEWQRIVNGPLIDAGFRPELLDFGDIKKRQVPFPPTATRAANVVATAYRELRGKAPHVSAIAHSFGTIAVSKALQMNPTMQLHRVILWGCVIRRSFPWKQFIARGQVSAVLNEACRRDPMPRLAIVFCALHGGGASGCSGFIEADDAAVIDRFHEWTNHDRLGTALHCEDVWIPFLATGAVV